MNILYKIALLLFLFSNYSYSQQNIIYKNIQELSDEYRIHLFIEPDNSRIQWGHLAQELENHGSYNRQYFSIDNKRFVLLKPSFRDSSILFMEHEAGVEVWGLRTSLIIDKQVILDWFKNILKKLSKIDSPRSLKGYEIILKGNNWEFSSVGLRVDDLAVIYNFLRKFE